MGLIVNYMLTAWIHGLGFDFSERFPALIETVTAADIQAAARTHLDPEHIDDRGSPGRSRETGNPGCEVIDHIIPNSFFEVVPVFLQPV